MRKRKILLIGLTWPEPLSTAAGTRMRQLVRFFSEHGDEVVFASAANESPNTMDFVAMGIRTQGIRLNHDSFDAFIRDLRPDMVVFDRFLSEEQFGWRVAESVPDALRILDTEDLHSLRKAREKAFKADRIFTTDQWLQSDTTKREIASIYRCDLSLIISSFEMELLTTVLKIDKSLLLYLPFMLDALTEKEIAIWPSYAQRSDFVFVGTGRHAPNVDAIVWLKKEIWPMIGKALPKAKLYVYGSYLPEHIVQLHNVREGFLIKGWAEDIHEVVQNARVSLAPLRFGAGIKGKLADAMCNGTPSVVTTIGAEGMHEDWPWSGAIADTAEGFAQAAVNLYTDRDHWERAQRNGIGIVNALYEKERLTALFHSRLEGLAQNLHGHRLQNFTGAMLGHQTLHSTKYMSKWIGEKNRRKG